MEKFQIGDLVESVLLGDGYGIVLDVRKTITKIMKMPVYEYKVQWQSRPHRRGFCEWHQACVMALKARAQKNEKYI